MSGLEQLLVWAIAETAGFDSAWVRLSGTQLLAEGRTVGLLPDPYWMTYSLETGDDFVTARLVAESRWADGSASLELKRSVDGWTVNGASRPDLALALDCDLAACPLTNTMPILRHDLVRRPGDYQLLMAFIEIPSLRVIPSRQRYTRVASAQPSGAVVKYRSGSFESDLVVDADGFVLEYPQLGRRLVPGPPQVGFQSAGPEFLPASPATASSRRPRRRSTNAS